MIYKRMLVIILLLGVFLICFSLMYRNANKKIYIEQNDIFLAISDGNGGTLNSVPQKGFYKVTVDCNNAIGSWDYNLWQVVVKNVTGNVTCDLTFKSVSTAQTFAQYVASLAGTTQGNGQVVNENGYRYEGKDPNNYVWFNNELWRIIGVFGSSRHGVTNDPRTINSVSDTYLLKIIRAESIGNYVWNGDGYFPNDWPNSTLYRMLNGCYYNALTGTDTTDISGSIVACSSYCLGYYQGSTDGLKVNNKCDFTVKGIQIDGVEFGFRDLIQKATWYLGGPGRSGYTTYYPDNIYNYETNSDTVNTGRSSSVTDYVGLMYLSDYGYSAPGSECTRGTYTINSTYASNVCGGNSWLYGRGYEWTIAAYTNNTNEAWSIAKDGKMYSSYAKVGDSIRPVVYLKSRTYKLDGTGTKDNPYIIGANYEYVNTFNYKANVQTVQITKAGYYKLEVYGAKGGNASNSTSYAGGNGGYAKGVVHLNQNDTLYIHTGGAGKGITNNGIQAGGTNGGGDGGYYHGGSGGGATDIRINTDSLYARIIVGGGGGGGAYRSGYYGGDGGGTSGTAGTGYSTTYNAKGGGTTSGGAAGGYSGYTGTAGTFGVGGSANTISSTTNYGRSGGGGGGWYGGGGGGYNANTSYYYYGQSGGGGGSSYTYSSSTASQVPSGWLLNSNYYMTSTSTTAGSNSGDGYAIVTYCGQAASDCS